MGLTGSETMSTWYLLYYVMKFKSSKTETVIYSNIQQSLLIQKQKSAYFANQFGVVELFFAKLHFYSNLLWGYFWFIRWKNSFLEKILQNFLKKT